MNSRAIARVTPAPPRSAPRPAPRTATRAPRPELRLVTTRPRAPGPPERLGPAATAAPVRPARRRPAGRDHARAAHPQHGDRRRLVEGDPAQGRQRRARAAGAAPPAAGGRRQHSGRGRARRRPPRASSPPVRPPTSSSSPTAAPWSAAPASPPPFPPRPRAGLSRWRARSADREGTADAGRASGPRPTSDRAGASAFTSRRAPGSRRGGAGLSVEQRGLRNRWGLVVMITLLVLVVGRLAVLQGVDGAAYANAAEQDRLRTYPIAALRGAVLDRDGDPSPTPSTPPAWWPTRRSSGSGGYGTGAHHAARRPRGPLTAKLSPDNRYVALARSSPPTTDAIDELELSGISFEDDPVRLPPMRMTAPDGGFGPRRHRRLRSAWRLRDELSSTDHPERSRSPSSGNPILRGRRSTRPPTATLVPTGGGRDAGVRHRQRLATACSDGSTTAPSRSCSTCHRPGRRHRVLPVRPRESLTTPISTATIISGVTGSVVEGGGLSAALEEGVAAPATVSVGRPIAAATGSSPMPTTIAPSTRRHPASSPTPATSDDHAGPRGRRRSFRALPAAFALGSTTGIELPGRARRAGELTTRPPPAANMPIGQGVSVTTLQMASIYDRSPTTACASSRGSSRGRPRQGRARARRRPAPGWSAGHPDDMAYMLEAVVGRGTAPLGRIEGFRVAGKTGTAQHADPACNCYAGAAS